MIGSAMNYIIAALTVTATAISVGISQGLTNKAAFRAIDIQPAAQDEVSRLALLSSALIETAAILGVFIAVILLMDDTAALSSTFSDLSKIGIGFAIIGAGFIIGLVSSWPAQEACLATARQPFHAQWIFNFTLIVLSVIQTPLILAFIVAFAIKLQAPLSVGLADSLRLIGAGIAIGIGCIGPAIGLAHFARTACRDIGINRNASGQLLTFTFISQAIIESPIIFAMVTALFLLFKTIPHHNEFAGFALFSAGLATGLGTFGPGLSSGRTAAAACHQIALNPSQYGSLSRTSIFAQGVIDTLAIYVLLISLLIILFI
jgi:F-type H+-transporting ATPase subunit c